VVWFRVSISVISFPKGLFSTVSSGVLDPDTQKALGSPWQKSNIK
jgi:hypothetical protein